MSFSYDDAASTRLVLMPRNKETITIPKQVVEICGSGEKDYACMTTYLTLKHVYFETGNKLAKIGWYAFYQCSLLEEIDLRKCTNLKEIGKNAFNGCKAAKSLDFPENTLETIDDGAFANCKTIPKLFIPASVVNLCNSFGGCESLVNVSFDKNSQVKSLYMGAFYGCPKLEYFHVPKSLEGFGNAFSKKCVKLMDFDVDPQHPTRTCFGGVIYNFEKTKVICVPPGITGNLTLVNGTLEICWCACANTRIEYVDFPETLTLISSYAFVGSLIRYAKFPDSCINYYRCAFEGSNISEVIFPKTINDIGDSCFFKCNNLKKVVFPNKFNDLGGGIFSLCPPDFDLQFDKNSDLCFKEQRIAYGNEGTSIVLYLGNYENITIYNTVKRIKAKAFYQCNIKNFIFQETQQLEYIEEAAFFGNDIEELVIPDSVKTIGGGAFSECKKLLRVVIGSSIEKIANGCFSNCVLLENVTFTGSYTIIGEKAFYQCYKLSNIDFKGVKEIGEYAFYQCTNLKKVELPATLTFINASALCQSGVVNVTFDEAAPVKVINESLFAECTDLVTINLPNSVKTFSKFAFNKVPITEIVIPKSLEFIDRYCFIDCEKFETFIIPTESKLTEFAYGVFKGCYAFTNIICNSTELELINGALYNKGATRLIVVPPNTPVNFFAFPETLRTVCQSALLHCINIQQIFIPSNSVTEIQNNAFEDCFSLQIINLPECVATIGEQAFLNCKKLQCGLLIDNRTDSYLKNLVEKALLPKKCLIRCDKLCPKIQKHNMPKISTLVLFALYIED